MTLTENHIRILCSSIRCNQYIHTEQLRYLDSLTKQYPENDAKIREYLLKPWDADFLQSLASSLQDDGEAIAESEEFRDCVLKMMCYDGTLDDTEREFFAALFPGKTWSEDRERRYLTEFQRNVSGCRGLWGRVRWMIRKLLGKKETEESFPERLPAIQDYRRACDERMKAFFERYQKDFSGTPALELCEKELNVVYAAYQEQSARRGNTELTLAIVGRTTMGKSTLLYLLSGQGDALIGEQYKQRTTKLVTVTHVDGTRVLDTPGLTFAAEGGRVDESVTLESLEYADGVCFMTTTGTNSMDTKEYLEKIAAMGKPIQILTNFRDSDLLESKDLKQSPEKWQSGDMWIKDLKRYAESNGIGHMLSYHSAFLYMAQIAKDRAMGWRDYRIWNPLTRKRILDASRYGQTMDTIFRSFRENGAFYRAASYHSYHVRVMERVTDALRQTNSTISAQSLELSRLRTRAEQLLKDFPRKCMKRIRQELAKPVHNALYREITDDSEKSLRKRRFEEIVNRNAQEANETAWKQFSAILSEEYEELQTALRELHPSLSSDSGKAQRTQAATVDSFQSEADANFFQSKSFRDILKTFGSTATGAAGVVAGMGVITVGAAFWPLIAAPLLIGFIPTGKQEDSWVGLQGKRADKRIEEIRLLQEKIVEAYAQQTEKFCRKVSGEAFRNMERLNVEIQSLHRDGISVQAAIAQAEALREALTEQFARCILRLRDGDAEYVRFWMACDTMIIQGRGCRKEKLTSLKTVIQITD